MAFVVFALEHADCGDAVVELGVDGSPVACWCTRCDDARTFHLLGLPENLGMRTESKGREMSGPGERRENAEDAPIRRGRAYDENLRFGSTEEASIPDYVIRDFGDAGDESAQTQHGDQR